MRVLAAFLVALATGGCGSDDTSGGSAGNGGSGGSGGNSGNGGSAGSSSGGSGGSAGAVSGGGTAGVNGTLAAPVIEMVMPMAPAGLHVTWMNVQPDCDEVEGERKNATEPYSVVFTVPGEVDNDHDGTATEIVEYTYRLRCRKGSEYSPYSNEMSGTPE